MLSCIKKELPAYPDYSKSSLPAALSGKPEESSQRGKGKGAHVLVKMAACIESFGPPSSKEKITLTANMQSRGHPDTVFKEHWMIIEPTTMGCFSVA